MTNTQDKQTKSVDKQTKSVSMLNLILSNVLKKPQFCDWLCGMTDGDGTFSFSINKKKNSIWNCTFKIAQSTSNVRLLYYIKYNLGCGEINLKSGKNMTEFRIRKRDILVNVIVPIFKKHHLYSTKLFYFQQFEKALDILENSSFSTEQKNEALQNLKQNSPPINYISPNWSENPSNDWIYGFTEAEGSFFLTSKGCDKQTKEQAALVCPVSTPYLNLFQPASLVYQRIVQSFGITQKLNKEILEFIRSKFHIPSKIQYRIPAATKNGFYKLETSNSRALEKIKIFYLNKLKGMKSLEFKIWARSFNYKNNFDKLFKIQTQLRKLRKNDKKAVGRPNTDSVQ